MDDPDGTVRLLSAILWELSSLPRGRPELYEDVAHEGPVVRHQRHQLAREVCGGCPERHRCPTS
jgi:hypothetical protein